MTQAAEVREWAGRNGYATGVRGRIAPEVWDAYAEAHPGFQREQPKGEWNCPSCKREWTGKKECHCTVCHRHFSTVDGFDGHRPDGRCIDPLKARARGNSLREKETMWGPIYVRDNELGPPDHWATPQLALGEGSVQT